VGRNFGVALAALLGGAVLPFAFDPYGYYPLAIVCLALMFYLWETNSPRLAVIAGYCFGLGMFAHGIWWIQVSVHQFGLPLYSFSIAVTAGFVILMSLYPALAAWLWHRCASGPPAFRLLLAAPAAWVVTEWLRGWLMTGFPWLLVGYTQTDSPLAAFAPVLGVHGVSLITATLGGVCAVLLTGTRLARFAALGVVGIIVIGIVMLDGVEWTRDTGDVLPVALVQGAIPQAVKWHRDYRQPSIDLYTELSRPHWGKPLVVWPETAIPAFATEVPETLDALGKLARSSNTNLLAGIPRVDPADSARYFNSVVQLGAANAYYDKRHLVPFGEYLPFDRWLRPLLDFLQIPMSNFSSGDPVQSPIVVDGHVIGVSICYEDAYATEIARALPDAGLLVNVSNDAWFGDSIAPHQHLQIARMRAIEAGRYLLRATNTGISAIIDDRGRVVVRSGQFKPEVITANAVVRSGATPAVMFPGWMIPGAGLGLLLIGCLRPARPD
jgi:apolipoprotein N-acyltransferase